jgi:hypothetical protein
MLSAMLIKPLDRSSLKTRFAGATPYPHAVIESFLDDTFAREVADSYPSFEQAEQMGRQFKAVNEYKKIQITDASIFPDAVKRLNEALGSPEFLATLEEITKIPGLLYDDELHGGGMHITGPRGRLDVHVDFNYLEPKKIYRRLNLLLYLNPVWDRSWGGAIEVWDEDVTECHAALAPALNRCLLFETSERSFHGVEPVQCPEGVLRKSFAVYYYTREPGPSYSGKDHTTIFKARPTEPLRKYVLMPAEKAKEAVREGRRRARAVRNRVKNFLGGA